MYLDFEFYQTEYGGTVPVEDFKSLNIQATGLLNYYTFQRLSDMDETPTYVKYAICELIGSLHEEENQNKSISSEKVGSYSVSYGNSKTGAGNGQTFGQRQRRIIHKWIPSEFLYRGSQGKEISEGVWKKDVY